MMRCGYLRIQYECGIKVDLISNTKDNGATSAPPISLCFVKVSRHVSPPSPHNTYDNG